MRPGRRSVGTTVRWVLHGRVRAGRLNCCRKLECPNGVYLHVNRWVPRARWACVVVVTPLAETRGKGNVQALLRYAGALLGLPRLEIWERVEGG